MSQGHLGYVASQILWLGKRGRMGGSFSLSLSGSDILQFSPHSVHPELATERYYKGAGASLVAQMAKRLPAMQEDQSFTVPFFSLTNVVFFLQERN